MKSESDLNWQSTTSFSVKLKSSQADNIFIVKKEMSLYEVQRMPSWEVLS